MLRNDAALAEPGPPDAAPAPDAGAIPLRDAGPPDVDAAAAVLPDAGPVPADAAPPPAPDPIDAEVVMVPQPVAYERAACLSTIECGTQISAGNRLSYVHPVDAAGANRFLVAAVATSDAGRSVEAAYGGAPMRRIGTAANQAGTCEVTLFGLAGPAPGSREVAVTVSGSPVGIVLSVATFINVDQTTPYRVDGYQSGSGTDPEVRASAPSAPGEITVDAACVTATAALDVSTPATPSVPVFDALIAPGKEAVQTLRPAGHPATTMRYRATGQSLDWATGVVSLRPAPP